MGSWGYSPLEDDTGLDWIGDLVGTPSLEAVTQPIDEAIESDSIDDLLGPQALAAAEVVAAMNGKPSGKLPEDAAAWASAQPRPDGKLLKRASRAVANVYKASELRDIWEDSGELDEWKKAIDDLKKRLG